MFSGIFLKQAVVINTGLQLKKMNLKKIIQSIIREELEGTSENWVRFSRLALILRRDGIKIKAGYFDKNPDFRIYRTENINVFYVTLPDNLPQNNSKHPPIRKRASRSRKVISKSVNKPRKIDVKPIVINSPESLEQAFLDILIFLTENQLNHFIQPEIFSNEFYQIYQKPIRQALKEFVPNKKLKNLLNESSLFLVRESSEDPNQWEVAIAPNSH